jgi:excisionase family DNA binding protein
VADRGGGEALVSLRDAAARLGVSPEALRQQIGKGRLPAIRETSGRRRYLIPESTVADLARGSDVDGQAGEVVSLRIVGEGELPVEAVEDLLGLMRTQFGALREERDRLLGELGRLQGDLDAAEVRTAALEGQIQQLRAKLAAAPAFFLARLAAVEQDWSDTL